MVDRISTASLGASAITDIGRLQSQLAGLSDQISSGIEADTYVELGSDINRVIDLEGSIRNNERFITNNNIILNRERTIDVALTELEEIGRELAQNLVLQAPDATNVFDLETFARDSLEKIAGSLNTTLAGRSLFAGSKTNGPAVNLDTLFGSNVLGTNATTGEINTSASYYDGDNVTLTHKASDTLELDYGVRANEEAFQNLIAAFHKAIESEGSPPSVQAREDAVELVNDALSGLTQIRSKVNSDIVTLENTNAQLTRANTQLETLLNDTIGADIVEASIQVSTNEAILTATLQTFVRLSNLKLSDFI